MKVFPYLTFVFMWRTFQRVVMVGKDQFVVSAYFLSVPLTLLHKGREVCNGISLVLLTVAFVLALC